MGCRLDTSSGHSGRETLIVQGRCGLPEAPTDPVEGGPGHEGAHDTEG